MRPFVWNRRNDQNEPFSRHQNWRFGLHCETIPSPIRALARTFSLMGDLIVAKKGMGFFDRKGHFFKSARAATESDLAALLGQIGEGESLAPGIAHMLLERREEIEQLFAEHDEMLVDEEEQEAAKNDGKVTKLPRPAG